MALVITRTQRRSLLVAAAAVLILAGVVVVAGSGGGGDASSTEGLPDESFALFDGGEATLADFVDGDRPLVINFWASWCPACVAELPEFQRVHEELGDDVTFLGLANADARGPALDLAGDVGLTYTLADDPQGELFRELELVAMPSTVFVSADGEVAEVFGGQLDEEALRARIADLGVEA